MHNATVDGDRGIKCKHVKKDTIPSFKNNHILTVHNAKELWYLHLPKYIVMFN